MKSYLFLFASLIACHCIVALPVDKKVNNEHQKVEEELDDLGLEYGRYLKEVVMTLEQDKHFSEKLGNVSSEDIKTGKIAGELDFVHHNVRTKLDELKRIELDRLRKLVKQENELNEKDHVDHGSGPQFTRDDLRKLIIKASNDLEEIEKKTRDEFKTYEMEKEYQYQESLKNMTSDQKAEAIKKHDEKIQKHKEHPRVHHPGSKQQFEEVWTQQDHMPKEEFNSKTFFALHDLNGDGVLDQEEVESLLVTEIKKLYDSNNPNEDLNEMHEEYRRMREHIYKEADKNRDGLISRQEFLDLTSRPEFEKDEGWKSLDEQQVYSQDELRQYEQHRQEALAHQYAYYVPQYHPGNYDPYAQQHPQMQYVPVQQHPGAVQMQQQQHPGAVQMQQQQHPGSVQMQQQHPGAVQMQQQHPGAVQMQQHPGAVPMQQHPGSVPMQQHPGAVQMQQHPGSVQMQQHPGSVQMQQHPGSVQMQQQPHIGLPSSQYPPMNANPPPQVGYQQPQINSGYPAAGANQASPQQSNLNQPPPVGYQQPQYASSNVAANPPAYQQAPISSQQQQQHQQQNVPLKQN